MCSGYANANRHPLRSHENVLVFSSDGKGVRYYPIKEKRTGRGFEHVGRLDKRGNAISSECYGRMKLADKVAEKLRYPFTIQQFNAERPPNGAPKHPTQKPVDLMEYFIRTYSQPGDTVLDFAMGSGTTGVAAANTGRNFIGIEKEEKYYDLAIKRIDEASRSLLALMAKPADK
jgi:site-specific DNA-methyltransferase (adenine-specific)